MMRCCMPLPVSFLRIGTIDAHGDLDPSAQELGTTGRFVLLPKNLVTGRAEARIVSRPTRRGRAPLEGDYLKPRLSRGFFLPAQTTLTMGHRTCERPAGHSRRVGLY